MIVTLTPEPGFAPVPHVRISIADSTSWDGGAPTQIGTNVLDGGTPSTDGEGFDAGNPSTLAINVPDGTDTVTLWWVSQDRTDLVPGAVRRSLGTTFGHLDVEAGFGVPTAYELECFAGSVSLGRIPIGDVTLPWVGDVNGCIIQNPMDPYLHAVVTNLSGSWPSLTWASEGELVRTQGSVFPTLVSAGPRQAAQDVAVDFGVATREESARVKATLGTQANPQLPVWLIRTHQGLLPRRFYGHVKSLAEVDINLRAGREWSRFQSTLAEIARPAPGLQVSPLSYDDLDASYASYSDRDAAYASYDEMDTDWPLAGAAG